MPDLDQLAQRRREAGAGGADIISIVDRLAAKDQARRARLTAFLATLPPERQKPRECRGSECCDGWVFSWRGPHDATDPLAGWVRYPCQGCSRGQLRADQQEAEEQQQEAQARAAVERQRRAKLLAQAGLPLDGFFEGCTIAGFAATANGRKAWYGQVKDWLAAWERGIVGSGLVLAGAYGVGKTGVAVAIGRELVSSYGHRVFFIEVGKFKEIVSASWRRKDGSEFELFDKMDEADLLILDDLGAGHGKAKDWDDQSPMSALFERLNRRYKTERATIITTNCDDPGTMQDIIGPRNMNRVADMCEFVLCEGVNLRAGVTGPRLRRQVVERETSKIIDMPGRESDPW